MSGIEPLVALRQVPNTHLAALVPHLRPFGTDERDMVIAAVTRWARTHPGPLSADPEHWTTLWDRCTRATPRRPGALPVTRTRCPECGGRRIRPDRRTGIPAACFRCRGRGNLHEEFITPAHSAVALHPSERNEIPCPPRK